jgi:type IV pilus assembly protein PilC
MKTFRYEAQRKDGEVDHGIVEANNRDEAMGKVRVDFPIVNYLLETGGSREIDLSLGGRRTTEKVLALMCNQFAIILKAGFPIVHTVELVADQMTDKTMKRTLRDVAGDVAAGYGLADSFANHSKDLPATFIETIRAGENSGNLEGVFRQLTGYYDAKSKTHAKVVSAMIYPSFVVAVAVVVVGIIMLFAVPTFSSTFATMGVDLPWITKAMIATSNFLVSYILVIIVVIAAIVIGLRMWGHRESGRMSYAKLALRVPMFGQISLMGAASQYAATMAVMLGAGLPVIEAVEVTGRSLSNHYLGTRLRSIIPELEAGKRLGLCLENIKVFPDLINEMTAVGEETGALETTLATIAQYYGNEVNVATARALSIMEPVIILVLAVFVMGILFSVYIPLFSLYGSIS